VTPALRSSEIPADPRLRADVAEYCLRLGDDRLVLGHRLSEWCGHAPILEEDIALTNIALDLLGQATTCLEIAAALERSERSADALAFLRDVRQFRNALLAEQPNGDFAATIVRQFLFDAAASPLLAALTGSSFAPLARLATRAAKETAYHLRHSRTWLVRLGDGTAKSQRRAQRAVDELWAYAGELLAADDLTARLHAAGVLPDLAPIREHVAADIAAALHEATLRAPAVEPPSLTGGRSGLHSEHLGRLLDEMQILPRSHPGARW